ncbi:MAG: hypothetical protein IAF02_16105 [Anaerolineae bacterium]|nr:hypothetical protein [Anaerolineae bacterium]
MFDLFQEENQRLKRDLASLRQVIIAAEPTVMVDGRFEEMITTPGKTITIAQSLIAEMTRARQEAQLV